MTTCFKYHLWQFIFLLLIGCMVVIIPCTAQFKQVIFERLSEKQGLSQSVINCIFQDSRGFIWIGGYAGLYRYDGYEIVVYYREPNNPYSIVDSRVNRIVEDEAGNLWISTQNGLSYFDRKKEQFINVPKEKLSSNLIFDIQLNKTGQVWIVSREGLNIYNPVNKTCIQYQNEIAERANLKGVAIVDVFEDQSKRMWLGTEQGLKVFDSKKQVFSSVSLNVDGSDDKGQPIIQAIQQDKEGYLWLCTRNGLIQYHPLRKTIKRFSFAAENSIGNYCKQILITKGWIYVATEAGLVRFNPKTQDFIRMRDDPKDPFSLSHSDVLSILEDNVGVIWLGTIKGIDRYNPSWERFKKYTSNSSSVNLNAYHFRSFYEINPGKLLMQGNQGLEVLDLQTGIATPFSHQPPADLTDASMDATCFLEDNKNRLWIGTADGGIFVMDKIKKTYSHFKNIPNDSFSLCADNIRALFQDSKSNIWVAHMYGGVSRFKEETNNFERYLNKDCQDRTCEARTIYEDHLGDIWIGTRGGLIRLNRTRNTLTHYFQDSNNPKGISENTAFDIYEDENKSLWIGTYGGGLNEYDRKTDSFKHYTMKDGLPDNNIFSIYPDKKGNLWLSTYRGIVNFNPKTKTFRTYNYQEGLLNKGYEAFRHYRMPSSGELVFEGTEGFDIFHPDSIKIDSIPPAVVITDLLLFNKSVSVSKDYAKAQKGQFYLPQSITETKQLELPYRMKVITFKFAALHFANPQKNQYAYQLKGFDKDWQYVGTNRTATYTNLTPGNYTFRVKASNADGIWNEQGTSIQLTILPPWWQTWWAYLLYIIALSSLVWVVYNYQRKRWQLQAQLQMEQREASRLKELNTFKSQLYANITHEFRTPLTVILGNVEELSAKLAQTASQSVLNMLIVIKRNGENLLRLINQMLDLSKLESGAVVINWQQGDIIRYIRYLSESFESAARAKQIELTFHSEMPELIMDYDADKMLKIVSNLLSNAIKFTPEGGKVELKLDRSPQQFIIQVKDSGIGIASEQLPYIFDRFYQADNSSTRKAEGAGIGLALTKELVSLLKGTIEVQSTVGKGSIFTVQLPITNQAPVETGNLVEPIVVKDALPLWNLEALTSDAKEHPLLLIVEDNADVANYIASCAADSYKIIFSKNGKNGIAQALENIPDIIISDVMMPEADGFELCETLKNDERTSHIPIILLTAKATIEDRITGLRRGADEYLAKPFNKEELQVRLQKLIELRKKLQQRYSKLSVNLPQSNDPVIQQEDAFVKKVYQEIEAHLSEASFGIEQLSHRLHLHRSQLYRKIKALTSKDPSQLIHAIRLRKAEEWLLHSEKNMTEIALGLGFSDSAHFSRTFKEAKGVSPSSFRKAHRNL